jgi:hypothetical protein
LPVRRLAAIENPDNQDGPRLPTAAMWFVFVISGKRAAIAGGRTFLENWMIRYKERKFQVKGNVC